jgi:hypothetical protein
MTASNQPMQRTADRRMKSMREELKIKRKRHAFPSAVAHLVDALAIRLPSALEVYVTPCQSVPFSLDVRRAGIIACGSILLWAAFLSACSTGSSQSSPPRAAAEFSIVGDRALVTAGDITEVIQALHRILGAHEPVAFVQIDDRNTMTVLTGFIYGPLAGGGDTFVFRRRGHRWRWDGSCGRWNA